MTQSSDQSPDQAPEDVPEEATGTVTTVTVADAGRVAGGEGQSLIASAWQRSTEKSTPICASIE